MARVSRRSPPEVIRELQRSLAAAGFDPGKVDGRMGSRTERAVRAFQKANGLAADGIPGPKTLGKLASGTAEGPSRMPRPRPEQPWGPPGAFPAGSAVQGPPSPFATQMERPAPDPTLSAQLLRSANPQAQAGAQRGPPVDAAMPLAAQQMLTERNRPAAIPVSSPPQQTPPMAYEEDRAGRVPFNVSSGPPPPQQAPQGQNALGSALESAWNRLSLPANDPRNNRGPPPPSFDAFSPGQTGAARTRYDPLSSAQRSERPITSDDDLYDTLRSYFEPEADKPTIGEAYRGSWLERAVNPGAASKAQSEGMSALRSMPGAPQEFTGTYDPPAFTPRPRPNYDPAQTFPGNEPGDIQYSSPVTGTFAAHRDNPFEAVRSGGRRHAGVDWNAEDGSLAHAVVGGTVVYTGHHKGYQYMADILGDDGNIQRYATHGKTSVKVGDKVKTGDPVGTIGRGHLHFEVIPPSSPAFEKAVSGELGETSRWPGTDPKTLNPSKFFGLDYGSPFEVGQPLNAAAMDARREARVQEAHRGLPIQGPNDLGPPPPGMIAENLMGSAGSVTPPIPNPTAHANLPPGFGGASVGPGAASSPYPPPPSSQTAQVPVLPPSPSQQMAGFGTPSGGLGGGGWGGPPAALSAPYDPFSAGQTGLPPQTPPVNPPNQPFHTPANNPPFPTPSQSTLPLPPEAFGPPSPMASLLNPNRTKDDVVEPSLRPTAQAPLVPPPKIAGPPPPSVPGQELWGGIKQLAAPVINAGKKAGNAMVNTAVKTWLASGPVERALIAGSGDRKKAWEAFNAMPHGPADIARMSLAIQNYGGGMGGMGNQNHGGGGIFSGGMFGGGGGYPSVAGGRITNRSGGN